MNKCVGCGATLQSNNKDLSGYVKDLEFKYCERCFRNRNYSEIKEQELSSSNQDIINKINESADITFFITDFLNISSEVIKLYNKIKTTKYLVINKMDVIPKDLRPEKIIKFLADVYKINDKVLFTSYKDSNLINYFKDNKNIYFCGVTNSGKSSLISKITGNKEITSSSMINTTLDYLTFSYDKYQIVDCPGFNIDINIIDNKLLKIINPNKALKIRNYQLKEKTILNIHDLIKIGFVTKNKVSCYVSNGLLISKEYHWEDLKELNIPSNSDLIILGIGFLNIKEKGKIVIDKNLKYEIRKSIF